MANKTYPNQYNIIQRLIDPRMQAQTDPTLAHFSIGNLFNNAGNDVKGLVSGLVGLPGRVIQDVQNPNQAGQDVVNLIKNTATGVNNAVGQPVKVQNGKITGIQAPSLYEASQAFYQNPITDALNIATLGDVAKGAIAKTTGKNTATTTTANNTLPGGNASDIPKEAVNEFSQRYTIPTKRAADLKPVDTSQEILAHVKSGMNPNIVEQSPALVTGDQGIVTNMTRDALGKIKGDVNVGGEASKQAGNVLNAVDNKMFTTPAEKQSIMNNILSGEEAGGKPLSMSPLDAYDYQRSLESIAAKYDFAAKNYLNPTRFADAAKADAYHAAANAVSDQINKAVGDQGILDTIKTPERMQALNDISPRLAKQVSDAQNVSELRHTAAPFVRLSKMQDLTENSGNSTFGKVAKGMSAPSAQPATAVLSTAGAKIGGFPGYAAGKYSGNLIDRLFAPEINNLTSKVEIPLQNAILKKQLNAANGVSEGAGNPIVNGIKTGFKLGPQAILNNQAQENQGGQQNNQPTEFNQHNDATITQRYSVVNPIANQTTDPNELVNQANQGKILPDNTGSIASNIEKEANQYKYSDIQKYNNMMATAQNLKDTYGAQSTLRNAWEGSGGQPGVAKLQTYANNAYDAVQKADPSILNYLSKGYDNLKTASDGKYSSMAVYLQYLSKAGNVDFTGIKTKEGLLNAIDSAMQNITDTWKQYQQFYGGQTAQAPDNTGSNVMSKIIPQTQQTQQPQSTGIYQVPVNLNSTNGADQFNYNGATSLTGNAALDKILGQ